MTTSNESKQTTEARATLAAAEAEHAKRDEAHAEAEAALDATPADSPRWAALDADARRAAHGCATARTALESARGALAASERADLEGAHADACRRSSAEAAAELAAVERAGITAAVDTLRKHRSALRAIARAGNVAASEAAQLSATLGEPRPARAVDYGHLVDSQLGGIPETERGLIAMYLRGGE